jgi:NADH:ubiquinone oxidoreductase subunit
VATTGQINRDDGAMGILDFLTWWRRETFGTALFTWRRGEPVGRDRYGNRYFQERGAVSGRRRRRWVLYRGDVEASKVPPEWHAWIHHTTDVVPTITQPLRDWEKPHSANLTGTPLAYRPSGADARGGHRAPTTGDYEPWQPA